MRRGGPCGRPPNQNQAGDVIMTNKRRKNIRLHGYDYSSAGGYFLTVCTWGRKCILSQVIPGNQFVSAELQLTEFGTIVQSAIEETIGRTGIQVKSMALMPNHIHLVLVIPEEGSAYTVGSFVGMFKSLALHQWRTVCNQRGIRMGTIWQRNFYEHIIRNEADYLEKLRYIAENPDSWLKDELYGE